MGKAEIAPQIDWNKDKLGIKDNVIGFANILKQEKYTQDGTSKVYSISAEFGIGKTFFCERLRDVLEQDNIPVSILNIWGMDFCENPLVPILVKLQEIYDISNKTGQKIPTKLLKWFKSGLSGVSVKANIPWVGEVCVDGKEMVDRNEKLNDKLQENDIYNEYKQFKTELDNLKDFLENWTKELDKPAVIIIDELDRCRPDYAVKTLEILKHFFDIPGLVFVLAVDEEQLKSSVETLFGTKNFDGYKRKFINNSFKLPTPDKESFTNYLYEKSGLSNIIEQIEKNEKDLVFKANPINYYEASREEIQKFNNNQKSENIIKHYFSYYSFWFNFTLRHMEQVFDRLTLFTKSILSDNEFFSPDLAVFLVCLHEYNSQIYDKIINKPYIVETGKGLFNCVSEEARKLYDIKYLEKFGPVKSEILPTMPTINNFSTIGASDNRTTVIHHNVDRFFKNLDNDPKKWIREEEIYGQQSVISNNKKLVKIIYNDDDIRWNGKKNFDNVTGFDLDAFKQKYFNRMDFISNFLIAKDSKTDKIKDIE